jgi:hypothetical protein
MHKENGLVAFYKVETNARFILFYPQYPMKTYFILLPRIQLMITKT